MERPENNKWLDEALSETIGSNQTRTNFEQWKQQHPQAVKMLTSRASRKASGSPGPLTTRRLIMKSPITKLAAAAVIIIAVMLSIHFWGKSTPTAYAFEQTIKAMQAKRSFHIQTYWGSDPKDEFWAEFDENGQVIRYRQEEGEYGTVVTLWENNVRTRYYPKPVDICLMTCIDNTEPELEDFDPQTTVQKVYDQVAQGKATIEIQEPSSNEDLITITVIPTDNSSKKILLVDPDTNFVTRADSYWPNDDEEQEKNEEEQEIHFAIEVLEYNQPIDANTFSLNLPESTITIDQVTQEVGMAQGDMDSEEFAPELVRLALEAWAAGDYAQAGKLFGGSSEVLIERYSHLQPLNIISIGQPELVQYRKPIYTVPCKYEVSRDGRIEMVEPWLLATAVDGQPGRWYVNIIPNLPKGS
jgi:hypothetical protein